MHVAFAGIASERRAACTLSWTSLGRRAHGGEPRALAGRGTHVLQLEERQPELQHAEDEHREHARDERELDRRGAVLAAERGGIFMLSDLSFVRRSLTPSGRAPGA